jgi:UDP-glucose 4-epimerase
MNPMKVLVTGGTGFIGGHIIRELLSQGHQAVAFDSSPSSESLKDVEPRIDVVRGEVQDLPTILALVKKFDVTHIVHTASIMTKDSQEKPLNALNVNVLGTVNMLEAARIMDLRKVTLMSTTAVYGITEEGKPIDEEYPQRPITIYGATKLLCEHYGVNYHRDYGIGFAALRFPIVYGPGQSYRGFSSFKEIIEKPIKGIPAEVAYGGDHKYDGIYVKDVAKAITLATDVANSPHSIFNIGTGVTHTLKDVARVVKKFVPDAIIKIGPGFDTREPIKGPLIITRAREEIGFQPQFDLDLGVKDYIESIQKAG